MKPMRESNGARTPTKKLNGSSRSATCAKKQQPCLVYTRAAEATTNNENDNEPRGPRQTALIMKPAREIEGAPTPRKKLNRSGTSAIYANRSSKPVSYIHTDQEFQANQRRAAPSTERRS